MKENEERKEKSDKLFEKGMECYNNQKYKEALKSFLEENKNYNNENKDFREIELRAEYKNILKKEKEIKTEFHGNRDFYSIIKSVAIEGSKLEKIMKKRRNMNMKNKRKKKILKNKK